MNNNFNFEKEFTILLDNVNRYLNDFVPKNKNLKLYDAFKYAIDGGGKRIRPILTLISTATIFQSKITDFNSKIAIGPALSIEILHNFTLIHDDIMDNSEMRHGVETVYKKWNNEIAILSGDLMIGYAFKALQFNNIFDTTIITKLNNVLFSALIEVCEGQELDTSFNNANSVYMNEYLEMIELKTSSLFRCAIKFGGIIASADENIISALDNYALYLGIAFQIQDDMLDFSASNKKFGKKIGQDIYERKKSYPIIKAKELATEQEDIEFINSYYNNEINPTEEYVHKFINLFDKLNISKIADEIILSYIQKAKNNISILSKNYYSEMLEWFLYYILKRNY